jgi:uncharacterized protein (TIGR02271 family)
MARTIVGTFASTTEAERVAESLGRCGIARRDIQIVDDSAAQEHRTSWTRGEGRSFWSWLFGDVRSDAAEDISPEDSAYYDERLRSGAVLLLVTTPDEAVERVRDAMEDAGASDVKTEATMASARATAAAPPASRAPAAAAPATAPRPAAPTAAQPGGEQVLPVVEEQVRVGKRNVGGGTVRVYTHVTERPVEEHIRLREERIRVERRPVDRPLTGAPGQAFEEKTIELAETVEEPVVEKQARVVEEVVIGKDVREREDTVRDTVRRTDVEVDRGDAAGFAAFEPEFKQHCTKTFGRSGTTYEDCSPAYRYGYELAGTGRPGSDWSVVEVDARRRWEERHPGTWERFKDSIRYAWDRARGGARAA